MKYGAEMAKEILSKAGYPENKTKKICHIIAIHDNPELGIPIKSKEARVLKEADILWMTTEEASGLTLKEGPN